MLMIVEYNDAVVNTAYSIFLNFYKATPDSMLLTEKDATELMLIMSSDYNRDVITIEKDISNVMKQLITKIPDHQLRTTPKYH